MPQVDPTNEVVKTSTGIKYDHASRLVDLCPYCKLNKDDHNLDWVQKVGLWQCGKCAKHWGEYALGQEYSLELEQNPFNVKDASKRLST